MHLLVCIILVCALGPARAQDWPTRPVKVIVPNGPGGISDTLARLTADRLSKTFGQPFVIDNRGGAGGIIGTEAAARAPNDGYTLYFGGGAQFTVNPLIKKLAYDPIKDLTPISMVSLNGMALAVHPDLPVRSLREFIDYVKANPGKLNYGVAGLGQSSHLAPAALAARAGLDMVVVPYQSTPPALVGLVSGTVQMFFGNVSDVLEIVHGGKARLLALSTAQRACAVSGCPDSVRNRSRLRHDRLDRVLRPGRHAPAHHRSAVQGAGRDLPRAGGREDDDERGHRRDRQQPGRICGSDPGRPADRRARRWRRPA